MALNPTSKTAQKAGYILLTSAIFHVDSFEVSKLLGDVRSSIADEMTLPTLLESINLIETLVYPRFSETL